MSILDIFKGLSGAEIKELFQALDDAFDAEFSEQGERRRFMEACRKLDYDDIQIFQSIKDGEDLSESSESLALKLKDPLRVAAAILMLETDLRETTDTNFLSFLLSVVKRDKVLKALNKARFLDWEDPLFENKNLPAEFIEFLWESNKSDRYKDVERFETLRTIAKHPNCPLSTLKELYFFDQASEFEDDAVLRSAIARNRNIDDELINLFINSTRKPERIELTKSMYIPQEALLSLMRDQYDEISDRARKQFAKRFPEVAVSDALIDEAIAKRVINPYKKPKTAKRKFDRYEDSRMGLEHIKSLTPSQRAAVINVVDKDVLFSLLDDSNKTVKRAIALRKVIPDEKLREYIADKDMVVASNAFKTISNKDPNVSFEDVFTQDRVSDSYELLNRYLNDKSSFKSDYNKKSAIVEAEEQRIFLVAQFTQNEFVQTKIISDLNEIPYSDSVRWKLLGHLCDNRMLCDNVVWKIYVELEFGGARALEHCKSKSLFEKIIESCPKPTRNHNPKVVESLYQALD